MKITDVRAHCLQLKEKDPTTNGNAEAVLVCVSTDSGLEGWAEVDSCPWVIRTIIDAPATTGMLHGLRQCLIGEDPFDIVRLWHKMYAATLNYGRSGATIHAMAGIDQALWDLKGKALEKPVYELLGGAVQRKLRVYATRGYADSVDENARRAGALRDQGFSAVKLGWGCFGRDSRFDRASAASVRDVLGYGTDLMFDAGFAFDAKSAITCCRMLEEYGVCWLEEPLHPDDIRGYAAVTGAVALRIAAGEQETSVAGFERLMDDARIDVVQIDVTRVGLTLASRIAGLAAARGLRCANHSFTTHLNIAASAHFMASIPNGFIFEYPVEPSELRDRLTKNHMLQRDGFITLSDDPGFGIEVDDRSLATYASSV